MSLRWLILDEVESTQDVAKLRVNGDLDVVFAHHQTAGRGRFDRVWESERGASLTMSLIVREPLLAPPYLYAMALAVAAADELNSQVQWPNDLVFGGLKVGGILAEVVEGALVIGIGVNLREGSVPPQLAYRAGFLGTEEDALEVGQRILSFLESPRSQVWPSSWSELAERWHARDATAGKRYLPADGTEVVAVGVNDLGALRAMRNGEEVIILAADAYFG